MVDAKRYLRLKPKGVVKVDKEEDALYLIFKRFDVESGQELERPEKQLIDKELIIKRISDIENELLGLKTILEDCKIILRT